MVLSAFSFRCVCLALVVVCSVIRPPSYAVEPVSPSKFKIAKTVHTYQYVRFLLFQAIYSSSIPLSAETELLCERVIFVFPLLEFNAQRTIL